MKSILAYKKLDRDSDAGGAKGDRNEMPGCQNK